MTKKSIGQLILIGMMPLYVLVSGPVNAAGQATETKDSSTASTQQQDPAQKNQEPFEQSDKEGKNLGPDRSPDMKQQQPYSIAPEAPNPDSVSDNDKDTATGNPDKDKDAENDNKVTPVVTRESNTGADPDKPANVPAMTDAQIQAEYDSAVDRCDDLQGAAAQESCMKEAKSKRQDAQESAKSHKEATGTSTGNTGNTGISGDKNAAGAANAADVTTSTKGAPTDEANTKLDEEYNKAIKDCDDQTHSTKNDCIAKVRTKYER